MTEDDIANILETLKQHEERIKALETAGGTEGHKEPKKRGNSKSKPSIIDQLEDLKARGFFDQPKSIGEIVKRLAQDSYHYPQQSLTRPLQRAVRQRLLGRVEKDGKWGYCKR